MSNVPLLQMEHIRKVFPGVVALDDVSLTIKEGTVHALMGENGAGKSTLMKILTGVYAKTEGTIKWQGQDLDTSSITHVLHSGITMIFQELNPIKTMKVCENIYVGREPYKIKGLLLDRRKIVEDTRALFADLDITDIDPSGEVGNLTVAKMQMIEIAKAISYDAKLIIMDEPTSAISEKECQHLFRMVNNLKKRGIAFIFITHKMDEVFQSSDEITIMRDGTYVGTYDAEKITHDELVKLMVGREITEMFPKEEAEITDVKLEVSGLNVDGVLKDIHFKVHKGEILGFAGLMGAGRTEVMETLFGIRRASSGTVKIFTYVYAGIMAAVAGMLLTARVASGQPGLGESFEMKAISGCVIGGVSLSGGIGSVYSLICGILIIGVLNNGMDLMNINGYMQQIAEGLILILAVLLDVFRSKASK